LKSYPQLPAKKLQMRGEKALDNLAVILHRPRSPENIGAAARAIWNMGLVKLILVEPRKWDVDAMVRLSTREAAHVVSSIEVYASLEAALADFQFVAGTTARTGGLRDPITTPRIAAGRLLGLSEQNKVGLLFGPEDRGLTNRELDLCQMMVRIPTSKFASLNVAQAVLILCYELHLAAAEANHAILPPGPLAAVGELESMYDQLRDTLIKISLIKAQNADYWMRKVRRFLSRKGLFSREVQMIRGLCRQIRWYGQRQGQRTSEQNRTEVFDCEDEKEGVEARRRG
jgi:tRNA/rRNA methyltransferase